MARTGGRRVRGTRRTLGNKIDCPKFNPDFVDFEHWREDVQVWRGITTTRRSAQGGTLYLAIEGKAKQHVHNMDKAIIPTDEGFDEILKLLDEVYMPEAFEKKYRNFYNLFSSDRKTDESLQSFVGDWHAKLQAYQSVAGDISSETSAMMLLVAAKLSAEERQSVKLHVGKEITYGKVREIMKIMATDKIKKEESFETTLYNEPNYSEETEEEKKTSGYETLMSRDDSGYRRGNYRGRQNFRSNRNKQYRGRNNSKYERNFRNDDFRGIKDRSITNHSKFGQTMKCYCCGSKYHLIRKCPDISAWKPKQEGSLEGERERKFTYNYFMVYMGGEEEGELKTLMEECKGYAVLDCGCPHTVCGEKWMENYIENLSENDRKDIEITNSSQSFTFGDGRGVRSKRKMKIPVWMGGIRCSLTTDVVEAEIPLLLSINVMERAKMVLDFAREEIKIHGKYIRVKKMRSGHYAMPLSM